MSRAQTEVASFFGPIVCVELAELLMEESMLMGVYIRLTAYHENNIYHRVNGIYISIYISKREGKKKFSARGS